jgi:hypothetical protein
VTIWITEKLLDKISIRKWKHHFAIFRIKFFEDKCTVSTQWEVCLSILNQCMHSLVFFFFFFFILLRLTSRPNPLFKLLIAIYLFLKGLWGSSCTQLLQIISDPEDGSENLLTPVGSFPAFVTEICFNLETNAFILRHYVHEWWCWWCFVFPERNWKYWLKWQSLILISQPLLIIYTKLN